MELEIEKIIVGQRFRTTSAGKVAELAESIREIGLINPIAVARENGDYKLIAGLHRLEAFKKLGLATIPAQVIEGDKLSLELAEVDENLKRAELTVLEQGELLIRRDEILRERGARAKQGDNRFTRSRGETVSPLQTTTDIAKELGFGERSAQQRMQIARKLYPEVKEKIRASRSELADSTSQLLALARLPQEKQKEVVDAIVSGNVKTVKSAQEASAFDMSEEVNVASDINFEVVDLGGIYIARHKTKDYRAKFNETNDSIKWAKWTWNPLTGCRGPGGDGKHCVYCYAKQRAENPYYRGAFPMGFAPTFYPDRLSAPQNTRIPSGREKEFGITEVFVCSMGDLFSACLPQEWIEQVLGACREAPQWNFLFLTKNPKRLTEIDFPANSWAGATVEIQSRVKTTEEAFSRVKAPIKFLSCEPLSEKLTFSALDLFDWVIIGAFKNGTQPNWEWVESLWWQARQAGCRIYIKENLTLRIQEYPD